MPGQPDPQTAFNNCSLIHAAAERLLSDAQALHVACDCEDTAEIVLRASRLELRLHKRKNESLRAWRELNRT